MNNLGDSDRGMRCGPDTPKLSARDYAFCTVSMLGARRAMTLKVTGVAPPPSVLSEFPQAPFLAFSRQGAYGGEDLIRPPRG